MKVSESWLREWVNPDSSIEELAEQLTLMGLEVDSIENASPEFTGVLVGKVVDVVAHPDADTLRLCQVDIGDEQMLSIVCGAPNARAGLVAPVATVGARLPGGIKIRKSKIRGVQSMGMLCSSAELGLSTDAEGLLELPGDAPAGVSLQDYLSLDDQVLDVELTPNRGDCLSIRGVARDICARNNLDLIPHPIKPVAPATEQTKGYSVDAGNACARYAGRVITGMKPGLSSPLWLSEKLRRCGVRSISPAVDVTNYVMMELGQPMHAFDMAKVQGDIKVRSARQGERLVLLDGREVELDEDITVIADDSGAIGIAGIMGGLTTAVDETTTDIFFESALFLPEGVAGRAWRLDAHSDSSHRFERGVDPGLQIVALEYATHILTDLCGGDAGPVQDWQDDDRMPIGGQIELRRSRLDSLMGMSLPNETVTSVLSRLEVKVAEASDGWLVTPPTHRYDLRIEEDYVEELARIHGYDNVPRNYSVVQPDFRPQDETLLSLDALKLALVARGYQEAVTFSFVDADEQAKLEPDAVGLKVSNPISSDMSVMRTSLVPGLLGVMRRNAQRQHPDVRIFESGLRFVTEDNVLKQENRLAGLISGRRHSLHWDHLADEVDFFDLKGDLEVLMSVANGVDWILHKGSEQPFLHPGVSADIIVDGEKSGWIGQLHPNLQKSLDMSQTTYMFELAVDKLHRARLPVYEAISRYPQVRRDISVVVNEKTPLAALEASIWQNGPTWLKNVVTFDVYSGDNIESGMKSLSLGLILQDFSRTLEESEVETAVQSIVHHLNEEFGAILRG